MKIMNTATILVVDDESAMERLIALRFRREIADGTYRFLFACNGYEALATLETTPDILVVLCDIVMPGMDGMALLAELHDRYPLVCPIVLTAFGNSAHIRTAMNLGAYDFLDKSSQGNDLKAALAKAVRHASEILRTVTARRKAEERLKQSEQQYRALVEQVDDGIAVLQEQRLVFMNEALRSMLGDAAEALLTQPPAQTKPRAPLAKREGAQIPPCPPLEKGGAQIPSGSWQLRHSTGEDRELWLECSPTDIQWEGKAALLLTVRDVTAHMQHELELESKAAQLRRENLALKGVMHTHERFGDLVGRSPAMQQVYELILRAAEHEHPVLIYGESGTGKELVARSIRQLGSRNEGSFVPINCGAIPENLFESEMFGYRKGAFTGAKSDKPGCFDRAHQGTLFLDEVGELSAASQVKLLRVLETGEYTPVGGTKVKHSDARIIAATHRNLMEMVRSGDFREDLFYRLHVIEITVPPLRDRKEDLPLLIEFFMEHLADSEQQETLPQELLKCLCAHHWRGNIRELHNVLCRYVSTGHLSFAASHNAMNEKFSGTVNDELQERSLKDAVKDYEKQLITQTLMRCQGDREQTAAALGIPARTLRAKIRQYQIVAPYQRSL